MENPLPTRPTRPSCAVIFGFIGIGTAIAIAAATLGYYRGVANTGQMTRLIADAICTNESKDYVGWFYPMDDVGGARCMTPEDSAGMTPVFR